MPAAKRPRSKLRPARWRLAVDRPGVHSLSRAIPKNLKKVVLTASLLGAQNNKRIVWTMHLAERLHLYVADGGVSVIHRVTIVKLLTQHVVKGDFWVPTSGSPPCWWWGYQSLMTGSKWAAIFSLA